MGDINIKSSTVEKGLELAKDFLGKLIGPPIEELGMLMSDRVKLFRYKNQIKILNRAREYSIKNNLKTSNIPLKVLVPLLDNASLEESEELQDKWAIMLGNMSDSAANLKFNVLPYILSQISLEEFNNLKELSIKEGLHHNDYRVLNEIKNNLDRINTQQEVDLEERIRKANQEGFYISSDFVEIANLVRLGLISALPPAVKIEEFHNRSGYYDEMEEWVELKAEYDPYSSYHRITDLGELFIKACSEKRI